MNLRLLGKEDEMRYSTIVRFIEERRSKEKRKEWTLIVTGARRTEISENNFPHLLEFLLQCKERIEYNVSRIRSRQPLEHKGNYIKTKEPKEQHKLRSMLDDAYIRCLPPNLEVQTLSVKVARRKS